MAGTAFREGDDAGGGDDDGGEMVQLTAIIISFRSPSPKSERAGVCLNPELGALLVACSGGGETTRSVARDFVTSTFAGGGSAACCRGFAG